MRDPQRLDACYTRLLQVHKEYFPDLRMFQFLDLFNTYASNCTPIDAFYLEDKYFDYVVQKFLDKTVDKK